MIKIIKQTYMKKITSICVVMALCFNLFAQGIQFHKASWSDILAEAKAQDKIVFVDAYTTWCGPCKSMAANIFPLEDVGSFYNENFINAKVDMEKGDGIDIAKKYKVNAYPTFLWINGNGELVHRAVGGRNAADFLALGEAASDPSQQLMTLEQKYNNGERSGEFMVKYAKTLESGGMSAAKIANEYLNGLDNYDNPGVMQFVMKTTRKKSQKGFEVLVENKAKFDEVIGKEKVKVLLNFILQNEYFGDMAKMEAAYIEYFGKTDAKSLISEYRVLHYMYAKDAAAVKNFQVAAVDFLENHGTDDWQALNAIAWHCYENSEDKIFLSKAANWAEKSIKLDENYANTDTAAALYFKLGNKKKAKKWAVKSIEIAKKNDEDFTGTKELLKQIEAL
jgi:thiol-disulfide isomerase/thioredoxin